jgi:hypothetical protein
MRINDLLAEQVQDEADFMTVMQALLPLAMKELGINGLPRIKLQPRLDVDEQPSFGRYVDEEKTIYLALEDRHPLDIARTFAHELVHFKQGVEHRLEPDSGETGSPEENEAHEVAGVIMRHLNKAHPEFFNADSINLKENMDHDKDHRAVPELKAALLSRKKKIQSVRDDKDAVYDIIDGLMTSIAKAHGISGQKLHDMWVDQYKEIPDTWILK